MPFHRSRRLFLLAISPWTVSHTSHIGLERQHMPKAAKSPPVTVITKLLPEENDSHSAGTTLRCTVAFVKPSFWRKLGCPPPDPKGLEGQLLPPNVPQIPDNCHFCSLLLCFRSLLSHCDQHQQVQ